ncbi:MAG: FAD:protein FMN transferase [Treponema sp.]|nr:FAD:protein FMN transferase [Treponema sp.]
MKNKFVSVYSPLLIFVLFFISCTQHEFTRFERVLGTVIVITIHERVPDSVYSDIFARIHEIENLMSVNIPTSDVSRINAAAGIEPVQVHADTFKVIERALYFARLSDGAFDPTIGPLTALWDITENPRVPSQEEIDEILPFINWRNVDLDERTNSVFLRYAGMALDLGGIAKGFAADEAARAADRAGVNSAIIDLGGDIVVLGRREDGNPWRIGVQHPDERRGTAVGFMEITEPLATVVTSGIYERFFEADGIRYHHIFSPTTGFPARTGLLSVTIISDNSMDADALSTAIFVLGYERGSALLRFFPGVKTVFVFEDRSIRTIGEVNFTLLDNTFFF